MSVVRCAHCRAAGRCGCFECARASRGPSYAGDRQTNCTLHNFCDSLHGEGKGGDAATFFTLLLLPQVVTGYFQAQETFRCSVCRGTGYNHFPRTRR